MLGGHIEALDQSEVSLMLTDQSELTISSVIFSPELVTLVETGTVIEILDPDSLAPEMYPNSFLTPSG